MEALVVRALRAGMLVLLLSATMGASYRTQNFIVTAKTPALAREIGQAAERFRRDLAVDWLGHELPPWHQPCPIQARVSPGLGAGGVTSFLFDTQSRRYGRPVGRSGEGLFQARPAGRPFGWEMSVHGSRERVLDSVLPHEVTHTIFATHFGRPLPRWADEGACTTVEHESEKQKQHRFLYEFLTTNRGIPFNRMFAMAEYPADMLPLYSQGYSLARFLIAQGGQQKFVKYVGAGLNSNDWTTATRSFYGFDSLSDLQITWLDWVRQGSPDLANGVVAANTGSQQENGPQVTAAVTKNAARVAKTAPAADALGWYQERSQTMRNGKVVSSPDTLRVATASTAKPPRKLSAPPSSSTVQRSSRPQGGPDQRQVMIEWGQPRPFLAPSLATRPSSTSR